MPSFRRDHAVGVAALCKKPPLVFELLEKNGWWAWSSHPRSASMDHAKRRVLHFMYTMRDAAFDCDEECWSDSARACFLMHEHRRMVGVAEDMVQALGDLWHAYGGQADFASPFGADGSTHTPAVEVLAQSLQGGLDGIRWNRKRFHDRAMQRMCLAYIKCLGLVLVELRLLPRSIRPLLLPSKGVCRVCAIDHSNEELLTMFRQRDAGGYYRSSSADEERPRWRCWGEMLFEYARCVLVCFRDDISPQLRPFALKYTVFVSHETQNGLRAIRYLMAAAETQRLHGEPLHRLKSAFGHWKRVDERAAVNDVISAIMGAEHGALLDGDDGGDGAAEVRVQVRVGPPQHERMSMLLRTAVGEDTHLERPPVALSTDARSNRRGRLEVVHQLAQQAGLPPFQRRCVPGKTGEAGLYTDFDGCCWPLITRRKDELQGGDAVLAMV